MLSAPLQKCAGALQKKKYRGMSQTEDKNHFLEAWAAPPCPGSLLRGMSHSPATSAGTHRGMSPFGPRAPVSFPKGKKMLPHCFSFSFLLFFPPLTIKNMGRSQISEHSTGVARWRTSPLPSGPHAPSWGHQLALKTLPCASPAGEEVENHLSHGDI